MITILAVSAKIFLMSWIMNMNDHILWCHAICMILKCIHVWLLYTKMNHTIWCILWKINIPYMYYWLIKKFFKSNHRLLSQSIFILMIKCELDHISKNNSNEWNDTIPTTKFHSCLKSISWITIVFVLSSLWSNQCKFSAWTKQHEIDF